MTHTETSRFNRWAWLALALCCVLLFGSAAHHALGDMGGDSAIYVLLARAITTGQGYRDLIDPLRRPQVKFPPVFPLMLAPVVACCGPHAFWPMHALVAGVAVIAVLLAVALCRWLGDGRGAWLAGWGTALHPSVVVSLVCLWSEFPYLAWSLLALLALHRYRQTTTLVNRWLWIAIAGTAAATLTRTIGVAVLVAGACSLWPSRTRSRSWRPLLAWCIPSLLPFVAWTAHNVLAHNTALEAHGHIRQMLLINPYHPEYGAITCIGLCRRMWDAAQFYADLAGHLLSGDGWATVLHWWVVGLAVVGLCVCCRRRRSVVEWYVVWYLLALLPHPWREERLLLPLLPLLWRYLWVGGCWCVERMTSRAGIYAMRTGLALCLTLMLLQSGTSAAQMAVVQYREHRALARVPVAEPAEYSVAWARREGWSSVADYLELMLWACHHVAERVVIISRKPSITTLFSNQPSVNYPFNTDEAAWANVLKQPLPVLLIADQWAGDTRKYVWPFIARHPAWFTPVHTIGTTILFRYQVPGTGYLVPYLVPGTKGTGNL